MPLPNIDILGDGSIAGEAVILPCFEREKPPAGRLSRQLGSQLQRLTEQPGWKGRKGQILRGKTGNRSGTLIEVHGLGKRQETSAGDVVEWIGQILDSAGKEGRREITVVLPSGSGERGPQPLRLLLRVLQSGYRFDRFRHGPRKPVVRKVHLVPPEGEVERFSAALRPARTLSSAVTWSRTLGDTPPNEATPGWMVEQARAMAEKRSIDCRVLEIEELRELGMGGILAVGEGSAQEPRLVRLEWGSGDEVISFVGKGVTFDTGGISIKPSSAMEEMKYDKCGACAVLGIARAFADMQVPGRYRAYVPLVENMPDGSSYRPGDIIRCFNGKTVEILDTDAEGRMILADALAWAAAEKPDILIELSTLTGASVVALGQVGAALYTPEDALAEALLAAGERSGERLWRMPLWAEFAVEMKGVHADLRNLGSRWGGANSAAAFLGNFVGNVRGWAHLDIAPTAYEASREGKVSNATGFGVALLSEWILARSGSL